MLELEDAPSDLESTADLRARLVADARLASPADRAVLARIWLDRARAEAAVGNVFDQLVAELTQVGAPAQVIALAARASADEERHARVCTDLAQAYASAPLDLGAARRVRLAEVADVEPRLGVTLHVVHVCCISETLASAFVEVCLAACDGPALAEVHRRHLGDEIRHARVGWAYLATLSAAERAAIGPRLPDLLERQLTSWLGRIAELPEDGIAGHAYPPRGSLIAGVLGALDDLVLAGFDHVGVPTDAARTWRESRAPELVRAVPRTAS